MQRLEVSGAVRGVKRLKPFDFSFTLLPSPSQNSKAENFQNKKQSQSYNDMFRVDPRVLSFLFTNTEHVQSATQKPKGIGSYFPCKQMKATIS